MTKRCRQRGAKMMYWASRFAWNQPDDSVCWSQELLPWVPERAWDASSSYLQWRYSCRGLCAWAIHVWDRNCRRNQIGASSGCLGVSVVGKVSCRAETDCKSDAQCSFGLRSERADVLAVPGTCRRTIQRVVVGNGMDGRRSRGAEEACGRQRAQQHAPRDSM